MPLDTVKTRMQSLTAKTDYTSTLDCARKTFKNEGLLAFWSGSTARLGRLIVSNGLSDDHREPELIKMPSFLAVSCSQSTRMLWIS